VLNGPATLRRKSVLFPDIKDFSNRHIAAIEDLKDTFDVLQGYGLALPQIGIAKRALIVNFSAMGLEGYDSNTVMINPEIEVSGDTHRGEESCFSVPYLSAKVNRYNSALVKYTSELGEKCKIALHGFPAICLQHEIDHLDGLTYLNRISYTSRTILMKKIQKIHKRTIDDERTAKEEFEKEHREIMGLAPKVSKTGHSKKRKPKVRKKRPNKSKKK
jgi:peptide deformylase